MVLLASLIGIAALLAAIPGALGLAEIVEDPWTASGWAIAGIATAGLGRVWAILRSLQVRVARANHELRGALCAARLGLPLINPTPRSREQAARIGAIELQLRCAGSVLDQLSSNRECVDRGELTDVGQLVRRAAPSWRELVKSAGREFRLDIAFAGPYVAINSELLLQACSNLVRNAIEHGSGTVELRVVRAQGGVRIEVGDEGCGLPTSVAELVRRGQRQRGRHGHGLALVAEICEASGGRLLGAPSSNSGARVVIELPGAIVTANDWLVGS